MDIDAGLAAAGDAEQQGRGALPRLGQGVDAGKSSLLLLVQNRQGQLFAQVNFRAAKGFPVIQFHKAGVHQRFQRLAGGAGKVQQFPAGQTFKTAKLIQQVGLMGGTEPFIGGNDGSILRRQAKPCHFDGFIADFAATIPIKPKAGREHGLDGAVDGAEKALTHEQGQLDLLLAQNRRIVQHGGDGLQLFVIAVIAEGKNNALAAPVAPGEGHIHPHPRNSLILQFRRDKVIIGPVNPVCCGGNRNFCYAYGHGRFSLGQSYSGGFYLMLSLPE